MAAGDLPAGAMRGRGAAGPPRLVALDLDGVVYRGNALLPGAAEAIAEVLRRGLPIRYVTNNATLQRAAVAAKLRDMGLPASAEEVLSSGAATAAWLADRVPAGARLLVVGEEGLRAELSQAGFRPLHAEDPSATPPEQGRAPAAVVVGLDRTFTYGGMAQAQAALLAGALFVSTNPDTTFPGERGLLPGAGALLEGIAAAAGRRPDAVIGKPSLELAWALARTTGVPAAETLLVGDRLDTDISMGRAAGMRTVLVLTGVSTREDLGTGRLQPDAVLESLAGLPDHLSALGVLPAEGEG
jgi:phosphoglycolate/pyridoxal phosphate phosphatase family enzyme